MRIPVTRERSMTTFDIQPHLAAIAAQPKFPRCPRAIEAAYALNKGHPLMVFTADAGITLDFPGVIRVSDPDAANVTLIAHRDDPVKTAARVEECFILGQRVALWDAHADRALIDALLNTIIYMGNLAALDTDLERALAVVMTPLREGAALRRCLTESLILQWLYAGEVRAELARRFGEDIPARDVWRAEMQARARLGAYTTRLRRRGLPFEIARLGFTGNRLDGFWIKLQAV